MDEWLGIRAPAPLFTSQHIPYLAVGNCLMLCKHYGNLVTIFSECPSGHSLGVRLQGLGEVRDYLISELVGYIKFVGSGLARVEQ